MRSMCSTHCLAKPSQAEFMCLIERLQEDGVVSVGSHKDTARRPVALLAPVDELAAVLDSQPYWR